MEIDTLKYLNRFTVYNSSSLFPPDFDLLKFNRCPICGRVLYWTKDKSKGICKSAANDKFFITRNTMSRLGFV